MFTIFDPINNQQSRYPQQAVRSLNIGGAGIKDGIVLFGLHALLTIKFWE